MDSSRRVRWTLALYRRVGARSASLDITASLADTAWARGDPDRVLAGFREVIATIRIDPNASKGRLGVSLTNLPGVHVERHELNAALAAAREGLPLRQEAGFAWGALDHLALRAAWADKPADAARITGVSGQ